MNEMDNKLQVGKWTVSPHLCEITDGENTIHLEPKSMELLVLLASANGDLVSRKQIMDVVWENRVVTEYTLNNLISGLRKHLNEKGTPEAYIVTKPKLGYQLIAPLSQPLQNTESKFIQTLSPEQDTNIIAAEGLNKASTEHQNSHKKAITTGNLKPYLISFLIVTFIGIGSLLWWLNYPPPIEPVDKSIAVLPFDVFDSDEEVGYFADGLAEEIIHQLTVLQSLKVISRTSSFYYRDKDLPLTNIANNLNVSYVLEGSVRKVEDTMRVTLQLIKAVDDTHVWSKVFTANQQNKFSIQHDISTEVAHSIDSSFVAIPIEKRIFTPNSSEAYLRVLKGRKLNHSGTADATIKARDEFLMATLLEPEYADAYVDLGMSYLLLIRQKRLSQEEGMGHAKKAIERALELTPDLASAHAGQALLYEMNNQIPEAQAAYKKALEINPDLYVALINYANFFRRFADYETSIKYYEKARTIAPLSGVAQWGLGNVLMRLGRIEDSVKRYRSCIALLPDYLDCYYGYANGLRLSGKQDEADKTFLKMKSMTNPNDFYFQGVAGTHNLWQGNFEAANTIFEGMIDQYGLNNDLTLSVPPIKLWRDEMNDWINRLHKVLVPNEDRSALVSVHLSYAMSTYYAGQCENGIPVFEKVMKHRKFLFTELEGLMHGNNYLAMLAYCYKTQGRLEDLATTIALSEEMLSKIPEDSREIGGFLYSMAQTAAMAGKTERAEQLVNQIQDADWQLKWLIKEDPILQTVGKTNIANN
jgi:TolB-like protein/DNA-binding winged helix-turn-helix (wHTH) protein/Tfp pilus assembly protein PilF